MSDGERVWVLVGTAITVLGGFSALCGVIAYSLRRLERLNGALGDAGDR